MAVYLGRNVIIYQGVSGTTKAVAGAKTCTINSSCDLIEKASSTQQTAKEFIAGRSEWDVTMDHLVITGSEFEGINKVRSRVYLRVVVNGVTMKGYAICTNAGLSAPVDGLAKGTIKFKGDGELSSGSSPQPTPPTPDQSPIVYGFGTSASGVYANGERITLPTTAEGTYTGTATANGQNFYILVPYDFETLTLFIMGGVQFAMNPVTSSTIDGIQYKVYKSMVAYNNGTSVSVTASY